MDVSEVVGKFGRYHFILILVNILRAIPIGWTLTSVDFLAGDVDHTCFAPINYNGSNWNEEGVVASNACLRYSQVRSQDRKGRKRKKVGVLAGTFYT